MQNLFQYWKTNDKIKNQTVLLNPNWYVVSGKIDSLTKTDFNLIDESFAVFDHSSNFATENHLTIVGDLYLTNRQQLLSQLSLNDALIFGSDIHLVLKLWQQFGKNCLNLLQGMFAFIIRDQQENNIILVRDSVGSRTLYYTYDRGNYYIAPRLRTLLPFHSKTLNLTALRDYLICSFVPSQNTLWQDVNELPAGTILTLPTKESERYWQPQQSQKNPQQSFSYHSQNLRSLLEEIIQEYLPQDPIGIYLSGGLDSSCITALSAKFHKHKIHTYSLYFGEDCPNELAFSSLVANHCRTEHNILEITPQKMWDNLPLTLANLDDPIGDPLTVPNYLLAQMAKENSQIILNGEGGDPCFGGPKNQPMLLSELYHQSYSNSQLLNAYLTSFKKCFLDLPQLLKPEIFNNIKMDESCFLSDLTSGAEFINRLMLINIKFKGSDHILTKVNNLTHSANLIGLSPLFDRRIVQLSLEIPPYYKLKGTEEKAVLKEAVKDLLPEAIITRPKSGMRVPVQYFFYKYWRRKAKRLLLSKNAKIADYLNQDLIKEWLNYQGDLWGRYGLKLWLLVSLEIWLQVNEK